MPSTSFLLFVVVCAAVAGGLFRLAFKQNQLLSRRFVLCFVLNLGLVYGWVRWLQYIDLWRAANPFMQAMLCLVVVFVADLVLSVLLMWPFKNRKWQP